MDVTENYRALKEYALSEGMALFGVADVTSVRDTFLIPNNVASRFPYAVSMAIRLSSAVLDTVTDAPNEIYYFHYQRANILLDQTAFKVLARIQKMGYEGLPIPASQIVDWTKQTGSLSHREIARLAGLGWYGRNNLLVTPEFGSKVRYVTVLTDLPLTPDKPREDLSCGSCRACVSLCPAQAISDNGFDRDACHRKLKEFTKIQRIGQMICGVCVKVCPGKPK